MTSGTCSTGRLKRVIVKPALLVAVFILAATCTGAGAQSGLSKFRTAPNATLRICVVYGAPDLMPQPGVQLRDNTLLTAEEARNKLRGMTLDMINVLYGQILQWQYTVRYFDTVTTGFSQVAYKVRMGVDCDIGVQSFFVSAARDLCLPTCPLPTANTVFNNDGDYEKFLCCLGFSYPYYNGGWSFMSQVSTGSNINYLEVFFQRDIVQAFCVCVICLFVMAHLIWLIERTQFGKSLLLRNPKEGFSRFYLDGLKDGMWFSSMSLMNGVVNSEKTIITPFGRLVATTWVLFGILMSAFLTAVIAASLTTSQLTTSALLTASDMAGKKVCTSLGFFESFFDFSFPGIGVQKLIMPLVGECFPLVASGAVDAAFTVREEALGYFAAGNGAGLIIAPIVKAQAYGMIWAQTWPYADWVNEALLQWQQNVIATQPPYADAVDRWYYGDSHQITYGGNAPSANQQWNWILIGTAIALVLIYMSLQAFVMLAHLRMKREGRGDHEREQSGVGSSKKGTNSQKTSFFMRAASAIAAPPGALTVDPADVPDMSFRQLTGTKNSPSGKMTPATSMNLSNHDPNRSAALYGAGTESATLADIMRKLDVLMDAHHASSKAAAASPSADMAITMLVTPAPAGRTQRGAVCESPMLLDSAEEPTQVKRFKDSAWA